MTHLLDASVLIALTDSEHQHHDACAEWLARSGRFALCPVTQGALVRYWVRVGESITTIRAVLTAYEAHPDCSFWPDDLSYADCDLSHVRGHKQVTDAYLVSLAVARGGRLATLDQALAAGRPAETVLVTE